MNLTDASIEMNFADVASDTATEGITDAAVEDAIDAAASAVEDVADAAIFGGNKVIQAKKGWKSLITNLTTLFHYDSSYTKNSRNKYILGIFCIYIFISLRTVVHDVQL